MKDARRFLPLLRVLLVGLMLAVWLPRSLVAPSRQRKNRKERETMKKKTTLFLLLACLALLSLTACFPPGSGAKTFRGTTPDRVLSIELWTDHEGYESGEPVNVRAKLTNISGQTVTLRSKSESDPVMDIVIEGGPNAAEQRVWSQEHPDDVLYILTLAPGESYEVEWTQNLSVPGSYSVKVIWIDNAGYRRTSALDIYYDLHLPMP